MPLETEKIIKGRIAEAIAEEMFKELGFFVMKLGKEHTANPLDQLKDFVKLCGGKFNLEKLDMEIREITHINVLPDFIIVHPNGKVGLLEVKFRRNAELYEKDFLVFKTYPEAHMLIINNEVSENIKELKTSDEKDNLNKSRFHIWTRKALSDKGEIIREVISLTNWLAKDFSLDSSKIIEKYDKLVIDWIGKK